MQMFQWHIKNILINSNYVHNVLNNYNKDFHNVINKMRIGEHHGKFLLLMINKINL